MHDQVEIVQQRPGRDVAGNEAGGVVEQDGKLSQSDRLAGKLASRSTALDHLFDAIGGQLRVERRGQRSGSILRGWFWKRELSRTPCFDFLRRKQVRCFVHLPHRGVVYFRPGVGDRGQLQRVRCWRRGRLFLHVSERRHRQRDLFLRVHIKQGIQLRVDKSDYQLRGKTERGRHGEQVGEHGAVVPTKVAIGAGTIFPGVAPVGAGGNDENRSGGRRRVGGHCVHYDLTVVARAQLAQPELSGAEVINPRRQSWKVLANNVEFDLVERPGTSRGPEKYLAAGIFAALGDAGGEEQELRELVEAGNPLGFGRGDRS